MRKVIEVRNLYKLYRVGDEFVRALDGVDFEIYEGEFCAIVGTSGSGKSTLLNMLAGLEKPTKGEVIIAGKHIEKLNEEQLVTFRRDHVGFIFQSFHLMGTLNAVENVALPLSFRGVPRDVRVRKANEMLDLVKLGKHKKHLPNQMSGGQQQRVLIARALCATRELLILDEPITGLDPMAIQDFYSMIRKLNREDKVAIIMVSHDLRNAVEEANKILHLQKQVLFYGPAHDYMNSKAAGHFFHEKEQGECLPTAACHMAKNVDGLENNEQKCSCGHTHAHSPQKIEGGNTHERA